MQQERFIQNKEFLQQLDRDQLYQLNLTMGTKQKKDIFFSPWTPDQKETLRPAFNNKHNKLGYDKFLCSVKHSKYANPLKRFKSNASNIESQNSKEEFQQKIKPIRIYTLQNTITKQDKSEQKLQPAIFMDSTKQFRKKYKLIPNIKLQFNNIVNAQNVTKTSATQQISQYKNSQKNRKLNQKVKRKFINTIILDNQHMDRSLLHTYFSHTYNTKFYKSTDCCKIKYQTRKDFYNKQMIDKNRLKAEKNVVNDKDGNNEPTQLLMNEKRNKFRMNTEINIQPGIFIDYPRFKNSKIYSTFQPYKTKQQRFLQQTPANMFRTKFQDRKKKNMVFT